MADEVKGATLVRSIIDITMGAVSAGTGTPCAIAMYMIDNEALAAGALADLFQDDDDPGYIWKINQIPVFTNDTNSGQAAVRYQRDIRAMRKFPGEDYSIVMVFETSGGASNVNFDGFVRMLFKRA